MCRINTITTDVLNPVVPVMTSFQLKVTTMSYTDLIVDAWSRGFDHAEYLRYAEAIAKRGYSKPHVVSEAAYNLITNGLELDMDQNIATPRPTDPESTYPNGLIF